MLVLYLHVIYKRHWKAPFVIKKICIVLYTLQVLKCYYVFVLIDKMMTPEWGEFLAKE